MNKTDFERYCENLNQLWNTHISRIYAEQFFNAGKATKCELTDEEMKLPRHNGSLYITHNEHINYYVTVDEMIESCHPAVDDKDYFVSEEDMQKCIDTNELWELQWYPDSPIGFYKVCGSSLEIVLARALEIDAKLNEDGVK